jgi:plastocyanin
LRKGLLVVALALALPAQAAAQGSVQEVAVGDDFFDPQRVSLGVGSASVHWGWSTAREHNVRQDDRIFYSGALSETGNFAVTPSAGTFHYYCELHGFEAGGMDGEIRAKPTATANGSRAELLWATTATDTGTHFDVRQKVGKKPPKLVEERTREFGGTFKLKPGKNQVQVRSRQGKAASDWSPKLNLKG